MSSTVVSNQRLAIAGKKVSGMLAKYLGAMGGEGGGTMHVCE